MHSARQEQLKYKKKIKKIVLLTICILAFIYLSLTIIFGENGLLRYVKLKSTKANLSAETKRIKEQNKEIKRQIEIIKKKPDIIEELAREQGLTREGELIFKYEDK